MFHPPSMPQSFSVSLPTFLRESGKREKKYISLTPSPSPPSEGPFSLPTLSLFAMLTLLCLCLLLTTFSTLVSSKPTSLTVPAVYNNCSGDYPLPLPDDQAAFKPQIRVNPLEIGKNGTGWEEWAVLSHNSLPDGTVFVLSYKWALGEPTSANVSSHAFTVWAHFPNGTFYHQEVRDIFKYEEHADGGFTYSIANNHFTWDPVYGYWNTSINAEGWIIEARTETWDFPLFVPLPS